MYFSSINNDELKRFHKIIPYNFNISLSDALKSDLFYIEPIIADSVYRIYLLFYCDEIISSNSSDVILENKCIICHKTSDETYFNFISDDSDKIILNQLDNYYSFEDTLTDEKFNGLVQLLRAENSFTENIQIKNSTVNGDYGTYVFNLKSTTIVDNGVLITNETLSSIGTVKLTNPTFKNSNYRLKLTVYTLGDVNVCDDSSTDNISETELIIDLAEDSEVNIPFNTLDLNCIVGFNAVVDITHDLPVIKYSKSIVLSSDKLSCTAGDTITLTATYLEGDIPLANEVLTFKNNGVSLGTANTNADGVAVFSYIPQISGDLNITVINKENKIFSNVIEIAVNKKETTISISVDDNNVDIGDTLTISGVLQSNNELLSNCTVKIMNGNTELYSVTINANGEYSKQISVSSSFNYDLKAVYEGDSVYSDCESEYVNVIARDNTYIFIYKYTSPPIYAGETIYETTGTLYNSSTDTPISNKTITVRLNGSNSITSLTTDSNGKFTTSRVLASGNNSLIFNFSGDTYYAPSTATHNVSVIKHSSVFKDVVIRPDNISGYLVQSETGKAITNSRVAVLYDTNYELGAKTDSNGYFSISPKNSGANYKPNTWNSLNYSGDVYNSSATLDLTEMTIVRYTSIEDIGSSYSNYIYTYVGKLVDDLGNAVTGKTIHIVSIATGISYPDVTTDSNGLFTFTSVRESSFTCTFDGDDSYDGCTGTLY